MSILYETDCGFIISHLKFFEDIKIPLPLTAETEEANPGTHQNDKQHGYLTLNPNLFEITEPFKDIKDKSSKKSKKVTVLSEETKLIQTVFESLLSEQIPKEIFKIGRNVDKNSDDSENEQTKTEPESCKNVPRDEGDKVNVWPKNNFTAVHACQKFFEAVKTLKLPHFHGHNPIPDVTVISTVATNNTHKFMFPPNTKFYCNDVMSMEKVLQEKEEAPFDLIVMDPPWWNKFIRRRKRKQHEAGYEMIDTNVIAKLPIDFILNENGILVVWCTNAKSHQEKLINELFPRWGVKHEKTLYWLKVRTSRKKIDDWALKSTLMVKIKVMSRFCKICKQVTTSGKPICPFSEEYKKQPYEIIIIGRKINLSLETNTQTASTKNNPKLVISVPSSINSHKPPLIDVIQKIYPDKMFNRKLEIFARYLVPGFISYGNEVVKLQHESLYIQQS